VRQFLAGILVLGLIVAHVGWSTRIPLDWPTIALLGIFLTILATPELSKVLPLIKRFKAGEVEIELEESVQKLHLEVEKAEQSEGILVASRERREKRLTAPQDERGTEDAILTLAAQDKESAVVRLAIEIERELAALYHKKEVASEVPKTIRELVNQLVAKGILSSSTGTAIIEFRDVRNRVIHPTVGGTVPPPVLASAIDSGIRILRILRSAGGTLTGDAPKSES
jgi:hypothetical protein